MRNRDSERVFGPSSSLAFVVGTVVGTGIYLKPAVLATLVERPSHLFFLWAICGLFTTCGAVVYSGLARNWPCSGGAYVYLRETYGQWAASLLLAADVFLGRPAAVGALATGLGLIWELSPGYTLCLAVGTLTVLTLIQLGGSYLQGRSQVVLTALQLAPLAGILALGTVSPGTGEPVTWSGESTQWAAAFLAVLWAYDGWYNLTLMAGEVRRPRSTLPGALVGGLAFVTILYLCLNWVLVTHMSQADIADSPVAYVGLLGQWDLPALAVGLRCALSVALLATLNGTLACGSRVLVAAAEDGLIVRKMSPDATEVAPTLCFSGWCLGFLLMFAGFPTKLNLFDSLSELTALVVVLLTCLTVTCIFHARNFDQPVLLGSKLCGIFYIAVNFGLAYCLTKEGNLTALGGVAAVTGVGTILWATRRRQ